MTPAADGSQAPTQAPRLSVAWFYAAAAAITLLDQLSKILAVQHLGPGLGVPFLGPIASLNLTQNRGSAMGLLPGGSHWLATVGVIVVLALVVLGPRYARGGLLSWWGLCLLLGGALGNLMDRVRLGYVVDFIDFHWWPVFNVADIAVVCGAGLTAFALARGRSEAAAPGKD
jgi:signal peptidase II